MDKDELIEVLENEREAFLNLLEDLSDEQMEQPGVSGDWSIKDILSHLIAWETETIRLLWQARQGEKPTTLHFHSISLEKSNQKIYAETHNRELLRVLSDFSSVRKQTIRRIETFSDGELEDPLIYAWLEGKPLWEWIAQDTFQHEQEHSASIQEWQSKIT